MNASQPEAKTEYSRGSQISGDDSGGSDGRSDAGRGRRSSPLRVAVLGGGLIGAALLLVAEFTPLLQVHSSASRAVVKTIETGPHHSYALVPIAALAVALTLSVWGSRNRFALLAIGLLGVAALLIALLGDLPDAQASGLIVTSAHGFANATSSPSIGLYLETLGAIVLLLTGGTGVLLLHPPARPPLEPSGRASSSRTRSAS
jgi:hypothetical protein